MDQNRPEAGNTRPSIATVLYRCLLSLTNSPGLSLYFKRYLRVIHYVASLLYNSVFKGFLFQIVFRISNCLFETFFNPKRSKPEPLENIVKRMDLEAKMQMIYEISQKQNTLQRNNPLMQQLLVEDEDDSGPLNEGHPVMEEKSVMELADAIRQREAQNIVDSAPVRRVPYSEVSLHPRRDPWFTAQDKPFSFNEPNVNGF